MKTSELSIPEFQDLSQAELHSIGGEGFAYDAGRFLRFLGLSASGVCGLQQAIIEVTLDRMG
jgi:hypothetical protein